MSWKSLGCFRIDVVSPRGGGAASEEPEAAAREELKQE